MKLILLTILIFSNTAITLSQEETNIPKKDDAKTKEMEKKKYYSKEEFRNAVHIELEKKLEKLVDGKLLELSRELLKKEDELSQKELELERRAEQVKLNGQELNKKIREFKSQQTKFIGCLENQEKLANKRVGHMVEIIAGMKPQNAADILSVQDPGLSVQILSKLDAAKVSKIFNVMKKEISARLQKQYMNMKK